MDVRSYTSAPLGPLDGYSLESQAGDFSRFAPVVDRSYTSQALGALPGYSLDAQAGDFSRFAPSLESRLAQASINRSKKSEARAAPDAVSVSVVDADSVPGLKEAFAKQDAAMAERQAADVPAAPAATPTAASRTVKVSKAVDAAGATTLGSTAARAAAVARSVKATETATVASAPSPTLSDAPSVPEVSLPDATVPTGETDVSPGYAEPKTGGVRAYVGTAALRDAAGRIEGRPSVEDRAASLREARQTNPKAFLAATVLAELDPQQRNSLLTNTGAQAEARRILDVIANRALIGGVYTRGNGLLGGAMGEAGTISLDSLTDAAAARAQFSPINLDVAKKARDKRTELEANQRVMSFASGAKANAEMQAVMDMIDRMLADGYVPETDDTHYLANDIAGTKSWSRRMGKGTRLGGHTFKSDKAAQKALAEAKGKVRDGRAGPTGDSIADRIVKTMEAPGATRYDKEGNAYYADDEGNLVDDEGTIVEEAEAPADATADSGEEDEKAAEAEASAAFQSEGSGDLGRPYGNLEGWNETKQEVRDRFIALQEAWGAPLPVNSSHRSKAKNKAVGGAKKSQHIAGNAVDISVTSMSLADRKALIGLASSLGFTGIGVYTNAVHVDLGNRRSWGLTKSGKYSGKAVPGWAKGTINQHLANKFQGRTDEFARTVEPEFSEAAGNLPERNPYATARSRIAEGLKAMPDAAILGETQQAQKDIIDGWAKAFDNAEVSLFADPAPKTLAPSTPFQGLGEARRLGDAEANRAARLSATVDATRAAMGDINADLSDLGYEAGVDPAKAIAEALAPHRREGAPPYAGTTRTVTALGPRLDLGEVQTAAAAEAAAPAPEPQTTLAARQPAFNLDAALAKPGVLTGRFATKGNTLGKFKDAFESFDAMAAGQEAEDVAAMRNELSPEARRSIQAAVGRMPRSPAPTIAEAGRRTISAATLRTMEKAVAEANARIDASGLPASRKAAIKGAVASRIAEAVGSKSSRLASAPGTYAPTKQGVKQAAADARGRIAAEFHMAAADALGPTAISAPAGLTKDPNTDPPVEGMPSEAAIAEAGKTVEKKTEKAIKDAATWVEKLIDDGAKAVDAVVATAAKKIADAELPDEVKAMLFTAAVDRIGDVASRGIDEMLRHKKAEEKAKRDEEKAKAAKAKRKPIVVDPFEKALAELMMASGTV